MVKLTKRQAEILGVIKKFIAKEGYPPTRTEIAHIMEFKSHNAAKEHLSALHRKGAIQLTPGISRGIKVLHVDTNSA